MGSQGDPFEPGDTRSRARGEGQVPPPTLVGWRVALARSLTLAKVLVPLYSSASIFLSFAPRTGLS